MSVKLFVRSIVVVIVGDGFAMLAVLARHRHGISLILASRHYFLLALLLLLWLLLCLRLPAGHPFN